MHVTYRANILNGEIGIDVNQQIVFGEVRRPVFHAAQST